MPQSAEFTDILHKTGEDQMQVQVNNGGSFFNGLDVDNEEMTKLRILSKRILILSSLKNFVSEVIYSLHHIISIKLGL